MKPDDLDTLAARINATHARLLASQRSALDHAKRLGEQLAKARDACKEAGTPFGAWVKVNTPVTHQHALNYIRVAKRWDEIEPRLNADPGLSLRAALQLLAGPRLEHTLSGSMPRAGRVMGGKPARVRPWVDPLITPTATDAEHIASCLRNDQTWEDCTLLTGYMMAIVYQLTGRQKAPPGRHVLDPEFVEWMMGLPTGWTAAEGRRLSRGGTLHPHVNHLDLFSGIAGFRYALDLIGVRPAATCFSEIDQHAISVYRRHYPDAHALGDIRSIDVAQLRERHPGPWLVTGGFPCPDISDAGPRTGLDGQRSGLWREMLRVVTELRPEVVVAENVEALRRRGLDRVLSDLAACGYDAEWCCLRAGDFGAPHRRDRIWIVAHPQVADALHGGRPAEADPQPAAGHALERALPQPHAGDGGAGPWAGWQDVAATGHLHARPAVRRMGDGLPADLDRIRALGNAVVPQVAAWVLRRALAALMPGG